MIKPEGLYQNKDQKKKKKKQGEFQPRFQL